MSFSNHIFLFPFTINVPPDNKNFMSDIEKKLTHTTNNDENQWVNSPFIPEGSNVAYSEYFYFHPFAREAIFDTGEEDTDNAVMKFYTRNI